MEQLDFAERAGAENMKFHLANADALLKESNSTLLLVVAAGTALLSFATGTSGWEPKAIAAFSGGVWLYIVGALIVAMCLRVRAIEAPTNEPINLLHPEHELDDIRRVELQNLQARITANARRNDTVGAWLNRARFAAVTVPLVLAVAFLAGHLVGCDLCGQEPVVGFLGHSWSFQ